MLNQVTNIIIISNNARFIGETNSKQETRQKEHLKGIIELTIFRELISNHKLTYQGLILLRPRRYGGQMNFKINSASSRINT